jgi:hypothetical protein
MSAAAKAARSLFERKLDDLQRAIEDAQQMHRKQLALKARGSVDYDRGVHVAALSQTIQSLYTRLESILKDLLRTSGEDVPDTSAWHRDLLLLASTEQADLRPKIISEPQRDGLGRLLAFRHAVRNAYVSELRGDEVTRNADEAFQLLPQVIGSLRSHVLWFFGESGDGMPQRTADRLGHAGD